MVSSAAYLQVAQAAGKLGISVKALRLYEDRGLITPIRQANGWRFYGPAELERAGQIVGLRALGLSLAEIAGVLGGDAGTLQKALAGHGLRIQAQMAMCNRQLEQVRALQARLGEDAEVTAELAQLGRGEPALQIELGWPWAGETFAVSRRPLVTYLVGPLGSGKTRLGRQIADAIEGAVFLPMESRAEDSFRCDPGRLQRAMRWIEGDGGTITPSARGLLSALFSNAAAVVVDMVEEGLDAATQVAVAAWLARREISMPLFLMTRSDIMLDPGALAEDEAVIFCPPNHSPPYRISRIRVLRATKRWRRALRAQRFAPARPAPRCRCLRRSRTARDS